MTVFDKTDPETSFGVFKPVGNIVVVFTSAVPALGAQEALLKKGYTRELVTVLSSKEFVKMLDSIADQESVLAGLGSEWRKVEQFRDHAADGASFLVVYAPDKEETKSAMEIIDDFDYRYALKYGSWIIEKFDEDHAPQ